MTVGGVVWGGAGAEDGAVSALNTVKVEASTAARNVNKAQVRAAGR
jgi:hypothetical protein